MRRLLMVCYDFPPSAVGIWRTLKFCRYMRENGWMPAILTVRGIRGPLWDEGPLRELPPGTEIRRTGTADAYRLAYIADKYRRRFRPDDIEAPADKGAAAKATHPLGRRVMDLLRAWVLVPDDRIGWYPYAVGEGKRWLADGGFDAVYSTSYPHSAHLIGRRLAEHANLPFIADYRDIWIENYQFYKPPTGFHDSLHRRMERNVVRRAFRVVSATEPISEDFRRRYPEENPEKFATITNGFDSRDYRGKEPKPDRQHFTISYVGLMYGQTSPEVFLQGIRLLLDREPRWKKSLRLRFVGSLIEPYEEMIDAFRLRKYTSVESYVPHEWALQAMMDADALLLVVAPVEGSHIMMTQKVFEYVAARRPILALVPEGAVRDFLDLIGEGVVVNPRSAEGVANAVDKMLLTWHVHGRPELPDNRLIRNFERRRLARKLCEMLNQGVDAYGGRPMGEVPRFSEDVAPELAE
ncbi:MAG: glycosyltransferase [Candidatus Sumerlaeia bacterium]|nr:glycosyltransferase [Candidatus Sumerlaeia bacterium]